MIDIHSWAQTLQRLADEANRGCGLSFELFEQRFSNSVKGVVVGLSHEDREAVLELAHPLGYAEKPYLDNPDADDGCCAHGMDPYNCPVGCGDIE